MSAHYKAMLEDASVSENDKKAAKLFVDSEGKLNEDEDYEEALKMAQEAHGIFKASNHEQGKVDTLRLVMHSHKVKADHLRYKTKGDTVKGPVGETLRESEKFALAELEAFKSAGGKLGEAAMHLSLAELNADRRGPEKRKEALSSAMKAKALYEELNDKRGQANTSLVLAGIHNKNVQPISCLAAAEEALALYKELGHMKGEAKAQHAVGIAYSMCGNFTDATKAGDRALKVFQDVGSQKLIAFEMYNMARWHLQSHRHREALTAATNAAKIFKDINYGKGWQACAIDLQVQAFLMAGEKDKALKLAQEAVERFKKDGGDISEKRHEVLAMCALVKAHAESGEHDKAMEVHDPAMDICRDALDHKQWQANMLVLAANVHRQKPDSTNLAVTALQQAKKLSGELGDKNNEAMALSMIAEVKIAEGKEYKDALKAAEEEMRIFKETGDKTREARALLMVSSAHLMLKQNDVAMNMANEAQRTFAETEDRSGEARAYSAIASCYLADQKFSEAAQEASRSREMAKKIGNVSVELSALNLGVSIHLYEDTLKASQDAARLSTEAVSLVKKLGDQNAEVDTLLMQSMAFMAVANGEAAQSKEPARTMKSWGDKAVKPAQNAVAMCKKMKDQEKTVGLRAAAVYTLGSAHMLVGKFSDSMAEGNEAVDLYKTAKDKKGELCARMLIAETHFCTDDKTKALSIAKEVFEEGGKIKENNIQYRAQQLQFRIEGQQQQAAGGGGGGAAVAAVEEKKGLDPADVTAMVKAAVADSIDIDDGSEFTMDTPMMDAGMDSLSSVAFRNVLQKKSGMTLPASLMFDYPTPRAIVEEIVNMSNER